jgi:hypothetical protein
MLLDLVAGDISKGADEPREKSEENAHLQRHLELT